MSGKYYYSLDSTNQPILNKKISKELISDPIQLEVSESEGETIHSESEQSEDVDIESEIALPSSCQQPRFDGSENSSSSNAWSPPKPKVIKNPPRGWKHTGKSNLFSRGKKLFIKGMSHQLLGDYDSAVVITVSLQKVILTQGCVWTVYIYNPEDYNETTQELSFTTQEAANKVYTAYNKAIMNVAAVCMSEL